MSHGRIRNEVMNILNFFEGISLNEILLYLTSGYVFLFVFDFVCGFTDEKTYQFALLKTIVCGYMLTQVYNILPFFASKRIIDVLTFVILCIPAGYVLGRIYTSYKFEGILRKLKIFRSVYNNVWDDIIETKYSVWIRATFIEKNEDIYGRVFAVEDNARHPLIELVEYEICDLQGNMVKDLHDDLTRGILIDTSKCDRLEFVYSKNSPNHQSEIPNDYLNLS